MASTKYIIFLLGQQKFGMKLSKIKGIEKRCNVVPMPCTQEFVQGLINLRGETIPVFNLRQKFNSGACMDEAQIQMLVAESHDIKLGFEVDEVVAIEEVEEENILDVPFVVSTEDTEYFENVLKIHLNGAQKEDIVLCVSIDMIMSQEEFSDLAKTLEARKENAEE